MAEQDQVERLTHSIDEWNQWRQQQSGLRPDLSGANLSGVCLSKANLKYANIAGADLSRADLTEANFFRANLSEAELFEANLGRAELIEADLSRANLSWANLSRADLSEVNFNGTNLAMADLRKANLSDANLSETNLSGARFYHTTFAWVDLSDVNGLERARHDGPSTVNINSVILPQDERTRIHFLRGVGFTETQIEHLPSFLTPRLIEYHSLFISYAHQNEAVAQRLHTDLRKHDVPCWFAPHDLQPGNYFREGIDQAIHTQDKVLLLLSEHSVKSGWVRYEVELALARENRQQREVLFPIRLDDAIFQCTASWATSLQETRHIGDFTNWQDDMAYQLAFTTLMRHLKIPASPTL